MDNDKLKTIKKSILNGEASAFEEIYNETSRRVFFTCLNLLKNEADAEDVMQETYITAYSNLEQLKQTKSMRRWIEKIAANKCKDYFRKKIPIPVEEEIFSDIPDDCDELSLPEEYIVNAEKRKIIMDILKKSLSELQYCTVILYYFNQLTISEVADIMDCKEGSVKNRLSVARTKLKKEVEEYERKNNDKLYFNADVPFLTKILNEEAKNISVPDIDPIIGNSHIRPDKARNIKKGANIMNYKIAVTAAASVVSIAAIAGVGLMNNRNVHDSMSSDNSSNLSEGNVVTPPLSTTTSAAEKIITTSSTAATTSTHLETTAVSVTTSAAETVSTEAEEIFSEEFSQETITTEFIQPTIDKNNVIGAYKSIIESKKNYQYNETDRALSMTYTLYDIDSNGIPELIMIYGMHEASMQIAYYTYDESGVRTIYDGDGGHHSSLGYDRNNGQFVVISGHMGSGSISWYKLENNELINTDYLSFSYNTSEEASDYTSEQGIESLAGAYYDVVSDYTLIYSYESGEYSSIQSDGTDYSFLENYQF
jgi:RNA polymerase sigma factor, sigma-70 family